jgi:membrane associated rhomboid family serine protease
MSFGPSITPPVIKQLLIANAAVFLAQSAGMMPIGPLSASPADFWTRGFVWQPFSYMWLHGGLGHVAMNMFALWMFGSQLAVIWGAQRFLRFYLICGVGAGFLIVTYPWIPVLIGARDPISLMVPTLGASGAVYGVLLAYSFTWPDRTIMFIFPPVAFRAIWLIPILFVFTLLSGPSNVSHIGHLGGVLVGWLLLRSRGETGTLLSIGQIKFKLRRWQMRRRLRAVRQEDWRERNDDRGGPRLH